MKRVLVYGMTENPGGIESYLMFLMEKIKAYDIQLDFVTDFPTIAYEEAIKKAGSRIFYIPAKGKKLFKHWAEVRKILKENPEYESVYFNLLDAGGVFTAIVAKLMKRKVIVHSHNGDTDKKRLHKMCKSFLCKITDVYVACSKLAARYMFGENIFEKEEVLVIPNAIDTDRFAYNEDIRREYRIKLRIEDKFVICHVGRMSRQKNPYRLLNIFKKVYERDKSSVLLYIGDGDIRDEVTAYAEELNRKLGGTDNSCIRILGTRSDVSCVMQAADVFLLPSLYEGLPIVAIEAQTAGLPTIMSTNITEEVGLSSKAVFVDLEKEDEKWADTILQYKDKARTSGKEEIILSGYDKDNMENIYKRLAELFK